VVTILVSDLKAPERLALQGDALYWTDRKTGSLMTAPVTGGEGKVLAGNQKGIEELATDATSV